MKVTFNTQSITVIFKDGSFASFEHAIKWNRASICYDIIFVVDGDINICSYDIENVATIVFGLVDNAI